VVDPDPQGSLPLGQIRKYWWNPDPVPGKRWLKWWLKRQKLFGLLKKKTISVSLTISDLARRRAPDSDNNSGSGQKMWIHPDPNLQHTTKKPGRLRRALYLHDLLSLHVVGHLPLHVGPTHKQPGPHTLPTPPMIVKHLNKKHARLPIK
jgi:hypothetical protein